MSRSLKAAAVVLTAAALTLGVAVPASAQDPGPEVRTVDLTITDREDTGTGNPTIWALDTFKRKVTVTGGPNYQFPELADNPVELKKAETEANERFAEKRSPKFDVCTIVKMWKLRWKYEAVVSDDGTFVTTNSSATGSPGAGKSLVKDAEGTFVGGATAKLYAPAHWCSFRGDKYDGVEVSGSETGSTSEFIVKLFKKNGYPTIVAKHEGGLLTKWEWKYTRCAKTSGEEVWVNGKAGNSGDVRGTACPTPSASPSPTTAAPTPTRPSTSPVGGTAGGGDLPLTGPGVTAVALGGLALLVAGAVAVMIARRRRDGATFVA